MRRLATSIFAASAVLATSAVLAFVSLGDGSRVDPPPGDGHPVDPMASQGGQREYTFQPTGLEGGGFQNVVEFDPSGSGLVLSGGDVSGFHRSTDHGATWKTSNRGLGALHELKVASILFSRTTPGKVYAAAGYQGRRGGLLVSEDGGESWSLRSAIPLFSAGQNVDPALPPDHPRSTGELLAQDEAGTIYAATFSRGVMRSVDDGLTWEVLGLAGRYLRSLVLDPTGPGVLYAATYGDGVWATPDGPAAGFVKLAASPTHPEELLLLGSDLHVAAGADGLFSSADGGTTWNRLGSGAVRTDGPRWISIDGYEACGQVVLYAGATNGLGDSVIMSADGGATWSSLADDPSVIHTLVGGPGGEPWWLASAKPPYMLGGQFSVASSIAIEPGPLPQGSCRHDRVLVAGRSGVWGSSDGGDTWYPMVRHLAVSIARAVAIDPAVPERVYIAASDWGFLHSSDSAERVAMGPPAKVSEGFDIAIDPATAPGGVYLASGEGARNRRGEVHLGPDPAPGSPWISQGLTAVAGGKRPLGIAVGRLGDTRVLITGVEGSGIWRRLGSRWAKVNATAMLKAQRSKGASVVWAGDSSIVYLYDRESGVWRSRDRGRTWTKIWARTSIAEMTGYLAVAPADPGRLYVSVGGSGVYRIDGATSGTVQGAVLHPIEVGDFVAPGPIAVDAAGALFVAQQAGPGRPAALLRSADGGATWEEISDDTYRGAATFPTDLAVGPDGTVYVSTNGNGLVKGILTGA